MRTKLALGQAYGLNQRLKLAEHQGIQAKALCNLGHHALVFRRIRLRIGLHILVHVAFNVLNDLTGDELQFRFACRKIDEGASINQRRASNTHVYFLCAQFAERYSLVLQLVSAHNGVITEKHTLSVQDLLVGDELHLCHQAAQVWIGGHKTSGPCGSILAYGTLIGHFMPVGISYSHSDAAVWNSACTIHLCGILLAHQSATFVAHFFHVAVLVTAGGESVIDPQERAYLHLLVGAA